MQATVHFCLKLRAQILFQPHSTWYLKTFLTIETKLFQIDQQFQWRYMHEFLSALPSSNEAFLLDQRHPKGFTSVPKLKPVLLIAERK